MITAAAVVAADKVLTEETVRPGLIGLFFFVALVVATYFLWRSMNKQLKKVDDHFGEADTTAARRHQIPLADAANRDAAGEPSADGAASPEPGDDGLKG